MTCNNGFNQLLKLHILITHTYTDLFLFSDVNPCISGRHQCNLQSSYCEITGEYSYSCPCKKGYTGVPGSCTGTVAGLNMHIRLTARHD